MADVYNRIREMLAFSLQIERQEVFRCSRFVEDLGVDSFDLHELAVECEEEFGINLADADFEQFATVGDAVSFVESRIASPTPEARTLDHTGLRAEQASAFR